MRRTRPVNDRPAQHWAVIPAGGRGRRMGGSIAKQHLPLAGDTVLGHSLAPFLSHSDIDGVVLVLPANDPWSKIEPGVKPVLTTVGGEERCHSVFNGLQLLRERLRPDDWILVHDAARPCLQSGDLDRLLTTLEGDPVGGLLAVPVRDTLKRADADGRVSDTVAREGLWQAQTPQMFRFGVLWNALEALLSRGLTVTDEAAAIEAQGGRPVLVPGHASNLKITHPEDLELASMLLAPGVEHQAAGSET